MTNLRLFGSLAVCLTVCTASATDLKVQAGGVEQALGSSDPSSLTELKLTGTVNAADLAYLSGIEALRTLDLSGVNVEAYDGPNLAVNIGRYPANEMPAYALAGCRATTITLPRTITSIGEGALMGCAVKALTIPASVRTIGAGAFAACTSLSQLTVPPTVSTLGQKAFKGCTGLKSVSYKASQIPEGAFADCTALTQFTYTSITEIAPQAFAGCTSLQEFAFPRQLKQLGAGAFMHTGLSQADLGECYGLTMVGQRAFAGCPDLETVVLPSGMTSIGAGAFMDDATLSEITLPENLTTLEPLTFANSSQLTVTGTLLSEGIKTVGEYALAGVKATSTVEMPSSLEHLGDYAMADMTGLTNIEAYDLATVPTLGQDVWDGVTQSDVQLVVSEEMMGQFQGAEQWNKFNISLSGAMDIANDSINGQLLLAGRITDGGVTVSCQQPMKRVTVYDLAGHVLAVIRANNATECRAEFNTSSLAMAVAVVELPSGQNIALKLAK